MADRKALFTRLDHQWSVINFRPGFDIASAASLMRPLRENGAIWDALGELQPLIRAIFAIEGVSQVLVEVYEIRIKKASLFSWVELMTPLETAVSEHLYIELQLPDN